MKFILLTGLYRSGKTFTLKIMNQHKNVSMIGHGFLAYFKILESEYFKKMDYNFNNRPFSLKYLGEDKEYKDIIKNTYFDDKMIDKLIQGIANDIEIDISLTGVKTTLDDNLINYLTKNITRGNAKNVFHQICNTIADYNNTEGSTYVGFAELNLEQFIEPLIRVFKDKIKIIHIKRDPRAILASRNYSDKYIDAEGRGKIHPILLIAKMWRNSVRYKWHLMDKYPDNYFSLSYEELMSKPKSEISKLCKFLDIDYNNNLLDVSKLVDHDGKKWQSYSSFKNVKGFSIETIDRWKKIIPSKDLAAFEYLCSYEMVREGYYTANSPKERLLSFMKYKDNEKILINWIFDYDLILNSKVKEQEIARSYILNNNIVKNSNRKG